VFAPLMVPLLFLMAAGPVARWKQASLADIIRPLRVALAIAALAGVALPFAAGGGRPGWRWALRWRCGSSAPRCCRSLARLKSGLPPLAFWGMHLAHMGIAVCVVGIVMVKHYETERDVRMAPGDTVAAGHYTIRFLGVEGIEGPNYNAARGNLELLEDGKLVMPLHPEKRKYLSSAMPMTEAFIDPGLTRDIYVSLGDPLEGGDGAWSVRVYYKPFVSWIWGGVVMMALGGLLAASDRRYRLTAKAARAGKPGRPGSRLLKRFLIPLAVFLVLVVFLAVGLNRDPREVPSPLVGKPAPSSASTPSPRARPSRRPTCAARCGCSTCGPRGACRAGPSTRCWWPSPSRAACPSSASTTKSCAATARST
jgi:cytochrome c-type biogenesis protein CcmF